MGNSWGALSARAVLAGLVFHCSINVALAAPLPVKLVDTSTLSPGGTPFIGFDAPTLTSFAATWSGGGAGALRFTTPGAYEVVATTSTAIPGGTGSFIGFNSPDQSVGRATGANQEGIYRLNNAPNVSKVVDRNTPIPGGVGNFTGFGHHPVFGQIGGFYGEGTGGQGGVYRFSGSMPATISVAADRNMNFPGSAEPFQEFSEPTGTIFLQGEALFVARSATHRGVFRLNGPLTPLFDTGTPVPGGNPGETFTNFHEAVDQWGVALIAETATRTGVFRLQGLIGGGTHDRIADTTMPIPGGTGLFTGFESVNNYGGNLGGGLPVVVFIGLGTGGQKGIYGVHPPGSMEVGELLSVGDILDGKMITDLAMTNQSLLGYDLRFRANFADGSSGLYSMTVPEPGTVAAVLLNSAIFLRRRSRTHSV